MSVLLQFPGRFGDVIWALPTLRALARRSGQTVDLQIAGEFQSIAPLLRLQPYLGQVIIDDAWAPTPEGKPASLEGYDRILDLSYRGWPDRPLAQYTLRQLNTYLGTDPILEKALDLQTPWISLPTHLQRVRQWLPIWCAAFSEAHFELKYGIWELLTRAVGPVARWDALSLCTGGRWQTEAHLPGVSWIEGVAYLLRAPLLLADCSAWHVLAVATGCPTILVEPMEARWNEIFYPVGMDGPQVTLVRGHDGKPTFDARAVDAAIARQLQKGPRR